MHAQRLYNDRRWPFPWVFRITNAKPALTPPQVSTESARWDESAGAWILQGDLRSMGDAKSLEVSFQYRPRKGLTDLYEKTESWRDLPLRPQAQTGLFSEKLPGVTKDQDYEFRALVKHPLITLYGAEKPVNAEKVVKLH